jgi:hypothetical protein
LAPELRIGARRVLADVELRPVALEERVSLLPLLSGRRPRVVGAPQSLREDPEGGESGRAAGPGGREEEAQAASLRRAEDRRPLRSRSVEHRADVVHPLLERRKLAGRDAVRQAGAAPVEHYQSRERREAAEEPGERRHLPAVLDVRDPAVHVEKVERPFAYDLVGDVNVAALRVPRLGSHGASFRPRSEARNTPRIRSATGLEELQSSTLGTESIFGISARSCINEDELPLCEPR